MSVEILPRTLVNRILAHAQRGAEEEICGLIGAREGEAASVYPIDNAATDRVHRFHMDPHAQVDAMRRMRESGEQLFAIYHSHPHAPAVPSATDLAEAAYPDALYLIISLDTRGVLEMRGFRLGDGKISSVDLEMT